MDIASNTIIIIKSKKHGILIVPEVDMFLITKVMLPLLNETCNNFSESGKVASLDIIRTSTGDLVK